MTPPPTVERQGDSPQMLTLLRESNAMIRNLSALINEQSIQITSLEEQVKARVELDAVKHAQLEHRISALETNQRWFIFSVLALVFNAVRDLFYQ